MSSKVMFRCEGCLKEYPIKDGGVSVLTPNGEKLFCHKCTESDDVCYCRGAHLVTSDLWEKGKCGYCGACSENLKFEKVTEPKKEKKEIDEQMIIDIVKSIIEGVE